MEPAKRLFFYLCRLKPDWKHATARAFSFLEPKMKNRIIRTPALLDRLGLKKSAAYVQLASGTLPPAIKITGKAVGFVESEVDAVIQARIAGLDDDAIRALVARLVAARQQVQAHQ